MTTAFPTHQASVSATAEARRSIRKYTGDPVPEATLREALRIAGLAPSAWNVQPWRVVVARDDRLKQQLMEAAYGQSQVGSAPAVLVLYTDMADVLKSVDDVIHPGFGDASAGVKGQILGAFEPQSEADREAWGAAQGNIFLGYLLLALQSLGLSSSPMLGFQPDKVREILGLPAHVRFPALIAVGYADEDGFPHHRHAVDRFVDWR